MQVVITARAEADLEKIFDYIAQDSTINAVSFVRQLRAKFSALPAPPEFMPREI